MFPSQVGGGGGGGTRKDARGRIRKKNENTKIKKYQ
jgi:hypothetical protein